MYTHLIIQFLILFLILYIYAANTDKGDGGNALRALIVAVAMAALGLVSVYIGVIGVIMGSVLVIALISKVFNQSITSALLMLLALRLLLYLSELALVKYI